MDVTLIGVIGLWVFVSHFMKANFQYLLKPVPARVTKGRIYLRGSRPFGLK